MWLLRDPIFAETQPIAPRYARAIQRALGRAVGAKDVHALTASMHNPWSDRHEVREIHGHVYRLDELAAGLDLAPVWSDVPAAVNEGDPDHIIKGMRNDTIFRIVLHRSPRIMSRCKTAEAYEAALESEAYCLHARCEGSLDSGEVPTMLQWITSHRPFIRRDRAGELKAKRHAEGRTREAYVAPTRERESEARRLRALGWTIKKIAEQLRVGMRAIQRYLRRAMEVIGVIPIRANTPVGGERRGQCTLEMATAEPTRNTEIAPMIADAECEYTDLGEARPLRALVAVPKRRPVPDLAVAGRPTGRARGPASEVPMSDGSGASAQPTGGTPSNPSKIAQEATFGPGWTDGWLYHRQASYGLLERVFTLAPEALRC